MNVSTPKGLPCRICGTRLMVRGVLTVYCPNNRCGALTHEQRTWISQQPTFDYLVESRVIFTKCGKRFKCFKDYRDWVYLNELLQYAE